MKELDRRAKAIADAVMPRTLAQRITPYLEFMPRLTAAQQAAAANLGIFPRAADIGRDSPALLAYQRDNLGVMPVTSRLVVKGGALLDDRLAPTGKPLGPPHSELALSQGSALAGSAASHS